jgi:hypothetical protein
VDVFQLPGIWQDGNLSLSRLRRGCHFTLQGCRGDQSARVFRWEDRIFCEQPRQIDAEASRSVGQPGTESTVDGMPRIREAELWTLSRTGIYFVPAEAPRSLRYFDFASKQTRPVFEVDRDFFSGLSLSPDGRWIMYSLVGEENSDIMLVEHFR